MPRDGRLTSNVGADLIRRESFLGFEVPRDKEKVETDQYDRMKDKVLTEMKKLFRPEFINRIDASVVFRALGMEQIRQIVDLMLARVQNQLTEQQLTLEVTDEAKVYLVEKGFDQVYGARPMRRAIQNHIEDPLSEGLLHGIYKPGQTVVVTRGEEGLIMEAKG